MNVLWLSDNDPWTSSGGAELNDRGHIAEGWRRGHEVRVCTPGNFPPLEREFDLAVVSNVATFPQEVVSKVTEAGDYVVFHHDFLSLCRYRLHFPQIERCRDLSCESAEIWRPVVEGAELNVALSPLHEEVLREYHAGGEWTHIPSAVDPDPFLDAGNGEREGTLAVNPAEYKGRGNVLTWAIENPGEGVTLLGVGEEDLDGTPSNCETRDRVPYGEMPGVYGEHDRVVHLPDTVDPFCRVVVEGVLSGCGVVTNRNVGATSYDWFGDREATAEAVREAPARFWGAVEEA